MLMINQKGVCAGCIEGRILARELRRKIKQLEIEIDLLKTDNNKLLIYKKNRKSKKNIPKDIRSMVYIRSKGSCEHCGDKAEHIHHKDRSRVNNLTSNLIHLCLNCHQKEHGRHIPRLTQYVIQGHG